MNNSSLLEDQWRKTLLELFPHIVDRVVPFVREGTPLLLAGSLLRSEQIDALPIVRKEEMYPAFLRRRQDNRPVAISGYSLISFLLQEPPAFSSEDTGFLFQPCEIGSRPLIEVKGWESLDRLLHEFQNRKFGFAIVVVSETPYSAAFISLTDILQLCAEERISSEVTAKEIATPFFSLAPTVSLKATLEQMISRHVRRMIIADGDEKSAKKRVVTEREIISWIFSPENLVQSIDKFRDHILRAPVGEIESQDVCYVDNEMSMKDLVTFLLKNGDTRHSGCILCGNGIITPWDVVMKSWLRFNSKLCRV